jgi:O-antigen/teichoic acid export membrane protein
MAERSTVVEPEIPVSLASAAGELRKSFLPQFQYGVGLAIQKGLPYLLIPFFLAFFGEHIYSLYVLFAASTLMFTNLAALAIPNAIIPFWYSEKDKPALSWTVFQLLVVSQLGLSLLAGVGLYFIYRQAFGASAALFLTLLGLVYALLANFNVFLTGMCRARHQSGKFLRSQLFAAAIFVAAAVLLRREQKLPVLIALFLLFLFCQDLYLLGSLTPFLRESRRLFDRAIARRVLAYSLPLLPHLVAIAFYFWIDKYLVERYFAAGQFSQFIVSFQYAYAQAFIAQALAMYTFPLFCQLVTERQHAKLRSALHLYNLILAGLGTLWVAGLLLLQSLGAPLRINAIGFLILGATFVLWNLASNYINILWARFQTPAVTLVMIGAGLIFLATLVLGCWMHLLLLCYFSHLCWAFFTLLGLIALERYHRMRAGTPEPAVAVSTFPWTPEGI